MFLESMILHNFRCFSDIEIKVEGDQVVCSGYFDGSDGWTHKLWDQEE